MRECIFPGLNNAFGGAAGVVLPCSQPAVIKGNMAKRILEGSVNAFGYVLWQTHSLFFCFDTAPDLLSICKESYPNALIQPPKMHLGMCLSAVALSGMLPKC